MEKMLKIEEVAVRIDSSIQTINNWYRWKKLNPEHPLAIILPDYIQSGTRKTRYWKTDDIYKLIEFKHKLPHGRNGVLSEITHSKRRK